MVNAWTVFATKTHNELKKKNPDQKFKHSLKYAAKLYKKNKSSKNKKGGADMPMDKMPDMKIDPVSKMEGMHDAPVGSGTKTTTGGAKMEPLAPAEYSESAMNSEDKIIMNGGKSKKNRKSKKEKKNSSRKKR